jgi:hypothetical protein
MSSAGHVDAFTERRTSTRVQLLHVRGLLSMLCVLLGLSSVLHNLLRLDPVG